MADSLGEGADVYDEWDPLPEDRFLIHDLLGEGGTARVWRAWHRHRQAWCAVKVLIERYAHQHLPRRRFLDEARTMLSLDHRNVISAWEMEERTDRPFLVMEVADGGSLNDWMSRHGPMPPHMAVGVAIQICKGIAAAHRAGVVHRDIKPHNILINRKGVCKVTDFGIARIRRQDGSDDVPDATTVHTTGKVVGTLGYMAPEQLSDPRSADKRADVYGIGATLYHLLTDRQTNNLFMMFKEEPERLEGIPEILHGLLLRAVAYTPEERFSTVDEFSIELHRLRKDLPPDPEDTPQLTHDLRPEPLPPQGMTLSPDSANDRPDDLEIPTTSIKREAAGSFQPPPIPQEISSTARPSWAQGDHSRGAEAISSDAPPRWATPSGSRESSREDSKRSPSPPVRSGRIPSRAPRRMLPTIETIYEFHPPPPRYRIALLSGMLVVATLFMFFAIGMARVASAKRETDIAEFELKRSLNQMMSEHFNLSQLGGDSSALDKLQREAVVRSEAQDDAIELYIKTIDDILPEPQGAPQNGDLARAYLSSRSSLNDLVAKNTRYEEARETWKGRAEGPLGWGPVLLGLAKGPP